MTCIVGKQSKNPSILLSINVNSLANGYISELISFALGNKYHDLYEKITEQIIFLRFDELTRDEFALVRNVIEELILDPDLSEDLKPGARWWTELIKPLMDLDSRN